jgi:hypothetical protein
VKRILIDTNIYSYAMRGDPETIDILRQAHEIGHNIRDALNILS